MVYLFKLMGFLRPGKEVPVDTLDEFFPSRALAEAAAQADTEYTQIVAGVRPPHHTQGRRVQVRPTPSPLIPCTITCHDSTELCGTGWDGYDTPFGYVPWYAHPRRHTEREMRHARAWIRRRGRRQFKRFPHKYRLEVRG